MLSPNAVLNFSIELARSHEQTLTTEQASEVMKLANKHDAGEAIRSYLFKSWGLTEARGEAIRRKRDTIRKRKAYLKKMAEEFDSMVLAGVLDQDERDGALQALGKRTLEV